VKLNELEKKMLGGEHDSADAIVSIHPGAGGTEAMDWAQMLLRQYLKYCERKGFKAEVLEESEGDVAGIRSATLKIEGDYAFGHLPRITGDHSMRRPSVISPCAGRPRAGSRRSAWPRSPMPSPRP